MDELRMMMDSADMGSDLSVALAAWRSLGCRDGGRVDIKSDEAGRPHFLEVNPLAGLHPEHSDLPILAAMHGCDYPALIGLSANGQSPPDTTPHA